MRRLTTIIRAAVFYWAAFPVIFAASPADAGGTRVWELAGYRELELGKLDGTTVSSEGEVALGLHARAQDSGEIGLVWCALKGPGGKTYLGTGYEGKVLRVEGNKAQEIVLTEQLVVTSMVFNKKGDLFLAALPEPVIWRVPGAKKIKAGKPVKAQKWATLPEGTKHIWALVMGNDGRTIYAGTGPEGKLFAIGADGKANLYLDIEEEHVLSLALDQKNNLIAGTSPDALLLRVRGPGRFTTLVDFDGTEVKSILVHKKEILAAVNKFASPPKIPSKTPITTGSSSSSDKKKPSTSGRVGDGQLFRIESSGHAELLWEKKKGHVLALGLSASGVAYLGLGAEGKLIAVDKERVVRTELDLEERQVMCLVVDKDVELVGTGDAGAVYALSAARPKTATYITPPLDASTIASWGRIHWFSQGKLRAQSRSGNAVSPDKSWTAWSAPLKQGQVVSSTQARYLQLRFSWAPDPGAVLSSVELSYRPLNRRAVILELNPDSPFPKPKKSAGSSEAPTSARTIPAAPSDKHKPELNLSWRVDNPDSDDLRYRLWYRAVGKKLWRPITREDEEPLTRTRYTWNTEAVPEGRYQIKLVADDIPANDPKEALADERISVPVLVDNHQPRVTGLKFKGKKISGVAADSFSAISALEFGLDAGPWLPIFSSDGIFDESREEFSFELDSAVESGPHAVAVRAYDRTGNMGSAEIHLEIP